MGRGKVAIPYNTEDGTAKDGEHYEAQEGELIFCNEETEKTIEIPIMDEESYEKSLIMYVVIGEPRQIAEGKEGEGLDYSILDAKNPEDLTEEEKIALLGRPCLGNNTKLQIRIRESKEFKSSVDKLMARRRPAVGGELGGPKLFKTISSSLFVFFWVFYVMISALEAYGVIEPGF